MDGRKFICANCAADLTGKLYVVCLTCKQAYDLACANIPENIYHHRQNEAWICDHCKAGEHPPIDVGSKSSPDLQSVPQSSRAKTVTDTGDTKDIDVIRQIVRLETGDLLQGRLVAMISGAVNSQISPVIENCMGNISDRVAKIEIEITALENAEPQNANSANTCISIRECPTPLCISPVYEEEVYKSGIVMSSKEAEILENDNFGEIRIIVRDELTSIMDDRVTNIISLAVVDQITPIMQIYIGNLEGIITVFEDKLKLLETSRRRRRSQTSSRAHPRVSYPQSKNSSRANPSTSNLPTEARFKVNDPGTSHSSSADHYQEKPNIGVEASHGTTTNIDDDPLYVDEVRTIIRDELSNVLNDRLTKTISKAIAEQVTPAIETSFRKLSERVATIEDRINQLETIDNGNTPDELRVAPRVNIDKRDGLDHVKSVDNINIPEEVKMASQTNSVKRDGLDHVNSTSQFKSTTAVSDNKDGPSKLKSTSQINADKVNNLSELKSASRASVNKVNDPDEFKAPRLGSDAENDSSESGVDEKSDSNESNAEEKSSSSELEKSPAENVDEGNNNSGELNVVQWDISLYLAFNCVE